MDAHSIFKVTDRLFLKRPYLYHPGVIDQHVDMSKMRSYSGNHLLYLLLVGNVADDIENVAAERFKIGLCAAKLFRIPSADGDVSATR